MDRHAALGKRAFRLRADCGGGEESLMISKQGRKAATLVAAAFSLWRLEGRHGPATGSRTRFLHCFGRANWAPLDTWTHTTILRNAVGKASKGEAGVM